MNKKLSPHFVLYHDFELDVTIAKSGYKILILNTTLPLTTTILCAHAASRAKKIQEHSLFNITDINKDGTEESERSQYCCLAK